MRKKLICKNKRKSREDYESGKATLSGSKQIGKNFWFYSKDRKVSVQRIYNPYFESANYCLKLINSSINKKYKLRDGFYFFTN